MKFSTPFLIVASSIALASAKPNNTDYKYSSDHLKGLINQFSQQCQMDANESGVYQKCNIFDMETGKSVLEDRCSIFLSEECTKYYADPMSFYPNCKNDTLMVKYSNYIKEVGPIHVNYYCTVTSQGELCPSLSKTPKTQEEDISEYYKEDCVSKVCLDNHIKFYENEIKFDSIFFELFVKDEEKNKEYDEKTRTQFYKDALNYLKSSECSSKTNDTTAGKLITETSGATSIKSLSSLLSLIILLYVIF
eukprot:jgi/Orpsp1_1/1186233/evm.model.d7180000049093.1